jgi:hypothetical protein
MLIQIETAPEARKTNGGAENTTERMIFSLFSIFKHL